MSSMLLPVPQWRILATLHRVGGARNCAQVLQLAKAGPDDLLALAGRRHVSGFDPARDGADLEDMLADQPPFLNHIVLALTNSGRAWIEDAPAAEIVWKLNSNRHGHMILRRLVDLVGGATVETLVAMTTHGLLTVTADGRELTQARHMRACQQWADVYLTTRGLSIVRA
jgi:hypothetical protein